MALSVVLLGAGIALVLASCTGVVWVRRRRQASQLHLQQLLRRLTVALRALPLGSLPGSHLTLLAGCLDRLTSRHSPTSVDQSHVIRLLGTSLRQHNAARALSRLTNAQRQSAIGALLSLSAVLNEVDDDEPQSRALLWRCRGALEDLTARLQADQLERDALASRHLGDSEQALKCYRRARQLLQSRPQIARPHELDALTGQLSAA